MRCLNLLSLITWGILVFSQNSSVLANSTFEVFPPTVTLQGNFAQAQLLVREADADGAHSARAQDLTRSVSYKSSNPAIVTVNAQGQLSAKSNVKQKSRSHWQR